MNPTADIPQLNDLAFRRHILVQALILLDFLLSLTPKEKAKLADLNLQNKSVQYQFTLEDDVVGVDCVLVSVSELGYAYWVIGAMGNRKQVDHRGLPSEWPRRKVLLSNGGHGAFAGQELGSMEGGKLPANRASAHLGRAMGERERGCRPSLRRAQNTIRSTRLSGP